jgi:hypothetical protein
MSGQACAKMADEIEMEPEAALISALLTCRMDLRGRMYLLPLAC